MGSRSLAAWWGGRSVAVRLQARRALRMAVAVAVLSLFVLVTPLRELGLSLTGFLPPVAVVFLVTTHVGLTLQLSRDSCTGSVAGALVAAATGAALDAAGLAASPYAMGVMLFGLSVAATLLAAPLISQRLGLVVVIVLYLESYSNEASVSLPVSLWVAAEVVAGAAISVLVSVLLIPDWSQSCVQRHTLEAVLPHLSELFRLRAPLAGGAEPTADEERRAEVLDRELHGHLNRLKVLLDQAEAETVLRAFPVAAYRAVHERAVSMHHSLRGMALVQRRHDTVSPGMARQLLRPLRREAAELAREATVATALAVANLATAGGHKFPRAPAVVHRLLASTGDRDGRGAATMGDIGVASMGTRLRRKVVALDSRLTSLRRAKFYERASRRGSAAAAAAAGDEDAGAGLPREEDVVLGPAPALAREKSHGFRGGDVAALMTLFLHFRRYLLDLAAVDELIGGAAGVQPDRPAGSRRRGRPASPGRAVALAGAAAGAGSASGTGSDASGEAGDEEGSDAGDDADRSGASGGEEDDVDEEQEAAGGADGAAAGGGAGGASGGGPAAPQAKDARGWFARLWVPLVEMRRYRLKMGVKIGLATVLSSVLVLFPEVFDGSLGTVESEVRFHQNGLWAPISAILVMELNLGASYQKSWNRLVGTVAACAVSYPVLLAFSTDPVALGCILFVFMLVFSAVRVWPLYEYLGTSAALTMVILVLGVYEDAESREDSSEARRFVVSRTTHVSLGVVVALLVTNLVWPFRALRQLHEELAVTVARIQIAFHRLILSHSGAFVAERDPAAFRRRAGLIRAVERQLAARVAAHRKTLAEAEAEQRGVCHGCGFRRAVRRLCLGRRARSPPPTASPPPSQQQQQQQQTAAAADAPPRVEVEMRATASIGEAREAGSGAELLREAPLPLEELQEALDHTQMLLDSLVAIRKAVTLVDGRPRERPEPQHYEHVLRPLNLPLEWLSFVTTACCRQLVVGLVAEVTVPAAVPGMDLREASLQLESVFDEVAHLWTVRFREGRSRPAEAPMLRLTTAMSTATLVFVMHNYTAEMAGLADSVGRALWRLVNTRRRADFLQAELDGLDAATRLHGDTGGDCLPGASPSSGSRPAPASGDGLPDAWHAVPLASPPSASASRKTVLNSRLRELKRRITLRDTNLLYRPHLSGSGSASPETSSPRD